MGEPGGFPAATTPLDSLFRVALRERSARDRPAPVLSPAVFDNRISFWVQETMRLVCKRGGSRVRIDPKAGEAEQVELESVRCGEILVK